MPFLNHRRHLDLGLDLDQKLVHAWEHRSNKLHHQAKREPCSAAAELPDSSGLCEARGTMGTSASSLQALGSPQNLLQSAARDGFWYRAAGLRVPLPADWRGWPVPMHM